MNTEVKVESRSIEPLAVYTRLQAAKALGVSIASLDRLLAARKLQHRRVGGRVLFTGGDLLAFLDTQLVAA